MLHVHLTLSTQFNLNRGTQAHAFHGTCQAIFKNEVSKYLPSAVSSALTLVYHPCAVKSHKLATASQMRVVVTWDMDMCHRIVCTKPVRILGNDCPQFGKLLQDCVNLPYPHACVCSDGVNPPFYPSALSFEVIDTPCTLPHLHGCEPERLIIIHTYDSARTCEE